MGLDMYKDYVLYQLNVQIKIVLYLFSSSNILDPTHSIFLKVKLNYNESFTPSVNGHTSYLN